MGTHYTKIEKYLGQLDNGDYLEIGIDRGEGSTKFFADKARERGVNFVGVDMDPDQIKLATENVSQGGVLPENVEIIHNKGETYLQELSKTNSNRKFSMVYLDNFDWDFWLDIQPEGFVEGVKQKYRDILGQEMTNMTSQLTHLAQAISMLPLLTDKCLIVADDTWFEPREGIFIGKCSAVVPFLITQGFRIIEHYGYRNRTGGSGVILARGEGIVKIKEEEETILL